MMDSDPLLRLEPSDRDRLGETLRALLQRGSILADGTHSDLYHWAYENRPWVEEMASLLELRLFWENESRSVQAIPDSSAFVLKLKLDATLVLLTLWYEFDTAVRDRGESPPISLTAEELNISLEAKFKPLRKAVPSPTRLEQILRLAQRKNLLRFTPAPNAAEARIEVFSTIKRVIPFQSLEDWTHHADRFLSAPRVAPDSDNDPEDTPDEHDSED